MYQTEITALVAITHIGLTIFNLFLLYQVVELKEECLTLYKKTSSLRVGR